MRYPLALALATLAGCGGGTRDTADLAPEDGPIDLSVPWRFEGLDLGCGGALPVTLYLTEHCIESSCLLDPRGGSF
jgi:hypothetical protein